MHALGIRQQAPVIGLQSSAIQKDCINRTNPIALLKEPVSPNSQDNSFRLFLQTFEPTQFVMASFLDDTDLIKSISQLKKIPSATFLKIVKEIENANLSYQTVYTDLHSGGWHTASLYAPSKTNEDGILRDGVAEPTALAAQMPATDAFLKSLGVNFFAVRLACNDRDSWVWEHRDYLELQADKKRLRLHIPIVSNTDAVIQFSHYKVHMAPGWV